VDLCPKYDILGADRAITCIDRISCGAYIKEFQNKFKLLYVCTYRKNNPIHLPLTRAIFSHHDISLNKICRRVVWSVWNCTGGGET
jgi:hypothetical protein